jgi:predicted nucleic acid-binding protein
VVLHLMVDTSVWLDLAKKRDGQKLIHAVEQIIMDGDLELLVPSVVIDEFERNRSASSSQ